MAAAEQDLLFESFLKKRKDTMIFRWSNYWFRLRNTTLSFYTSGDANEACLRGKYYIYLVQSVREVKAVGASHTFEIVMKNGKRKLLSAESADLCKIWLQFLWKSMQLPAPGRKHSSCTWHDLPALEEKANAAVQIRPGSSNEPADSPSEPVTDSPANTLHSENESYSEDDDSPLTSVSDFTSPGIAENESYSEDDDSPLTSVSDFTSPGIAENQNHIEEIASAACSVHQSWSEGAETKADSDQGNEENGDGEESIYDVPSWQNYREHAAADTAGTEKGVDENQFFGIYDVPNSPSISSQSAGVTTDHAAQKSTDCYFASQDENYGRSTV